MKKTITKKYFEIIILLFATSILLWSCEFQENDNLPIQNEEHNSKIIEKISFSELPKSLNTYVNELKTSNKKYSSRSNSDNLIVDSSQIIKLTDSLNNSKYSIKFSLPNQPANVIYNLVLGTKEQSQITNPFILKYTINNMNEVFENGYYNFSKMKGTISEYSFYDFVNFINNKSKGDLFLKDLDILEPCVEYTNDGDNNGSETGGGGGPVGGGNSDDNDGNGDTNSNDGFFDSYIPNFDYSCNIDVWSNGNTGDVFAISWNCSDGDSGDLYFGKRSTCPGDGSVGINEGGKEDEPSCKSFNYQQTTSMWQEASIIDLSFHVYLYDDQGARYLYSQFYSQPILFGLPSNLFLGGNITPEIAAEISAKALSNAIHKTVNKFRGKFVNEMAVDIYFRDILKKEFGNFLPGGRVQFNSNSSIKPTKYQTYWIIRDKCDGE